MKRKDSRIKYNLVSSLIYQIVFISMSFIFPRLYLENFGSEVNGVLTTIKDIFKYMSLLEAGVGLATTQALYKIIANKDFESANSVLAATHSYYVKTGTVYSLAVIAIAIVYAFIVPNAINDYVLFAIVILTGIPSIFNFFVQAKYRILMEVDGRKYVINNSDTILQLVANLIKLLVLILTDSLILIHLVYCVTAVSQMVYLYLYAKRRYKWLDLKVKPDFASISQRNSVLVHQISGMVFTSTDIILISLLCNFKDVSVYNIYSMFFLQMQTLITSVASGFSFALGQMFNTDRAKFDKVYSAYETFYIMITFIIYTLMAVFLLPLIQIYTKGITDVNYTNVYLVFLYAVMNLLSNGKLPANGLLEYSGRFEQTRSHAVWEMIINLGVSVVAIKRVGICGAIFGTIVALVYRSIVMIYYGNRKVLGCSVMKTYGCWIVNGIVFAAVMLIFFVDSFSGMSFGRLVLSGMLHSVWIVGAYVLVNLVFRREAFKTLMELYGRGKKI